jgi:hypothetical protein
VSFLAGKPKQPTIVTATNSLGATEAAMRLNGRLRKRFGYECPQNIFAAMSGLSPYLVR